MKPKQRKSKACLRAVGIGLCYLAVLAAVGLGWVWAQLPDTLYTTPGQPLALAQLPFLQPGPPTGAQPAARGQPTHSETVILSLGSVVPIKTVRAVTIDRPVEGGLGHPISDHDTGERVALRSGEIVPCTIERYEKGCAGRLGELKGRFTTGLAIRTIQKNSPAGCSARCANPFPAGICPRPLLRRCSPAPPRF